ncbi:MAG: PAS domain-containing protein [Chloroflexi bacterium]|nr:PAS domain-containing protein [Chloroflexota bacterium]
MDGWAIAAFVAFTGWALTAIYIGYVKRLLLRSQAAAVVERSRLEFTQAERDALNTINRSFIEQAPAAMILVDREGGVSYFNASAANLFHLGVWSQGRRLIELIRDHDLNRMVRRALDGDGAATMELSPPGSKLVLHATVRPITSERKQLLGATVILENLTEMRRMEAARRDLFANVSHELRTPLASMKAIVETLEDGAIDDRHVARDFLGKVHGELDRLTYLVRDVLELSRIESGSVQLSLQAVGLQTIAADALDQVRYDAANAVIVVKVEPSPELMVIGDPRRCGQVLVNLLQNAIKYTPSGGSVTVGWRRTGSDAEVHVMDTGVGISEDHLPRIFERFYKVDKARARSEGSGTGLGLAIVKHLVTAMGGVVGVSSELGRGSDFWFSLPLAPAAPQAPVLSASGSASSQSR